MLIFKRPSDEYMKKSTPYKSLEKGQIFVWNEPFYNEPCEYKLKLGSGFINLKSCQHTEDIYKFSENVYVIHDAYISRGGSA